MEFEKWEDGEHSDMVKPGFADLCIEPEDIGKYREVVEEAVEDIEDVFGVSVSLKVVIAKTDTSQIRGKPVEETSMYAFIQGMGLSPQVYNVEENMIFLRVTDEVENWRSFLKSLVVHEEAHLEFQDEREVGYTILRHLLFEGHAMHRDRKVSEEKGYEWRQDWELPDIDRGEFLAELDKKRSWDEPQSEEVSTLFDSGGEKWKDGEGYSMAFHIAKDVMERKEIGVQELVEIGYEEWRKQVEKSVENLYGED
ncbi:MAG: DUF2268 domain-containing putative Zn-dependent protease [Candidatus Nanosalina sp.]